MRSEEFLAGMKNVDADLIEEAAPKSTGVGGKIARGVLKGVAAAALCAVVAGGVFLASRKYVAPPSAGTDAESTEPEQTEEPQEKPNKNIGGLVIFLVVAALGGDGAFYYFKIWKPKQNVKGSTDLDEFDFEDYDEDELEETDDTGGGETEGEEV